MRTYKVRILESAEEDIEDLADFLFKTLSREGAYRYLDFMQQEVLSLSVYADCFSESHSKTIRSIHPKARRMVSHNHKWIYVFHIEGGSVLVDRILHSSSIH
ncbi:MAG: type II toxin-antitoxin system RelE/ParE family toxin [Bacteroidales bacterium]|nr:type II toxin-antitoxin system RelE/ParE family toxin [Bacteroidales bacterium]